MLHKKIQEEIPFAMKSGDSIRLSVIRGLIAAFTNELVATRRKPNETLADEEALKVIMRQVKQRKESIEQFKAGLREDLVKKEEEELRVLQEYLPQMLDREAIRKIAEKKMKDIGVTDKSQAGLLIGAVMREAAGKADGALVKEVVDSLFS